jgi:predicted transcriptional regulator
MVEKWINSNVNQSKYYFDILTNENSKKVLLSLFESDKSAQDIKNLLNIPLSTVYRILTNLEDEGIIKVSKMVLNLDGHHLKIYHTKFNKIIITIDNKDIQVHFILKESEKMIDIFNKLRDVA